MGIFQKIITALRGGTREIGESIVDANAARIFEQEIRDAEESLKKAKRDLTEVMAKEMQVQREVSRLQKLINEHEGYATDALNKGREDLAMEVANKIVDLTNEKRIQQQTHTKYHEHATRLKNMIQQGERQVGDLRRQLVMVKTTDSVHKATATITENYANSNSKLTAAKESLDRIRSRQQDQEDRLAAGTILEAELTGDDLDQKLRKAGIGGSSDDKGAAQDILARLRARSQ
jgi:phage shock protein A